MVKGQADAPKVLPTVFVGLGSTGAKIVSRIKRQLDATDDDLTRQFYRYLRIHSETTPEPGVDEDIPGFVLHTRELDGAMAGRVFQANRDTQIKDDFDKWWPREPDDEARPWVPPLTSRTRWPGGLRLFGRLLLHHACTNPGNSLLSAFRDIRQSIQQAFDGLDPVRKQRVVAGDDASIECYIFGLLAGGTCSGALIDVAYLTRAGLGSVNLYGVMLLGDICYYNTPAGGRDGVNVGMQRKNTVFTLAELSLVQSATGNSIVQRNWIRRVGAATLTDAVVRRYPFDRMVFVGAGNDAGYTLGSFEAYQEFVADYYARLHMSQATARQRNRDVIETLELLELDESHPSRFNQSARIGMFSLSVPVRKIMAAATSKVAIRLAANHFKNAEETRCQRAQNEFLRQVRWPETSTLIEPGLEDLSGEQFRPLPDTRDEFRALYAQRVEDVKGRYERWKRLHDQEAQAKSAEFTQRWRGAIQDLVHDFLGRAKGSDVALGGLKAVVKSLLDHVVRRTEELSNWPLEIRSQLLRGGNANPESVLRAELEAVAAVFPETSLMNPLAIYRRRNWNDDQNLLGHLNSYRDVLRADAVATLTVTALKQVRLELECVELARALVARQAGEVLASLQSAADDEFDTSRVQARTPHEEVLKQRDEVETCFVGPLLEQPDPSAEPVGDGACPTRLDSVCADIMTGWRSDDGQPVHGVFAALVETLRDEGARNELVAQKSERVRMVVRSLRQQFERQVAGAVDKHLRGPVEAISVWHALAEYARMRGGDVAATLLDYFGGLKANVGLFTRLSADVGLDASGPRRPRSYYICDSAEAAAAFRDLGISNPESFLEKLLTNALGYQPAAMAGARPNRSEVVILMEITGDQPVFFDEFHNDVRALLRPDAAVERDQKYWTDRRFPEWIAEWREGTNP